MLSQQEQPMMHRCCHGGSSQRRTRRGIEIAAGALSVGVWALMPKCPICVAAYVAIWTGVSLSFTMAAYLRWSMLFVCITVLLLIAVTCRLRRPPKERCP